MRKITTLEELMEVLEEMAYNYYALRGASEHDLEIADRGYLDCSYDLCNRRDCDYDEDAEVLNGTCGIAIDDFMSLEALAERYEMAKGYSKNHHCTEGAVYLIADKNCESGEDENEVILGSNGYGADVIAIVAL